MSYYSYLVLTQQNGSLSMRKYNGEYEDIIRERYFHQEFPEQLIHQIKKELRTDCYICRMPMHLVGPGIPFNAAVIEYSATEDELKQIRSSIIEGNPGADSDGIFVYEYSNRITILNLTRHRFNFTNYKPPFLNGLHVYTYIVSFKKILVD